jgi:hypothetical protein
MALYGLVELVLLRAAAEVVFLWTTSSYDCSIV